MGVPRIRKSELGVLVIDIQPLFMDWAFGDDAEAREAFESRIEHLLMISDWMDLPLVTTFEKPTEENGEFPDRLEAAFPAGRPRHVKNYFGCMTHPEIAADVAAMNRLQIAVAGAETDVCVLQSVLGLLDAGYQVFLLEDCVSTTEASPGPALRRMYAAGAVPCTLKTMVYELVECVDHTAWYSEGWVLKDDPATKPFPTAFTNPESWPPWDSKL